MRTKLRLPPTESRGTSPLPTLQSPSPRSGLSAAALVLGAAVVFAVAGCKAQTQPESAAAEPPFASDSQPPTQLDVDMEYESDMGVEEDEVPPETTPSAQGAAAEESDESGNESVGVQPAPGETTSDVEDAPRSPTALLTTKRVAFMVDYLSSEVRRAAEQACGEGNEEDASNRAECLKKARNDFKADVLVFDPMSNGSWRLRIYQRDGSNLTEVFTSAVTLSDVSKLSAEMKFVGGQQGQRPLFSGMNKVTLTLPTDSSLVVEDPKYGSLPYTAKIGLVGQR